MPGRITTDSKFEILRLHRKGFGKTDIKVNLNAKGIPITRQGVAYWIQQHELGAFGQVQSTPDPKPTILKKISSSDINIIDGTLTKSPTKSSTDIRKRLIDNGADLSLSTAKRAIKVTGYTGNKAHYNQLVRDVNKDKRLKFCQSLTDTNEKFEDVIFSDECSVQLHQNKLVYYRKTDCAQPTLPKPKHPLKLHLWGAISKRGAAKILVFDGIMTGQWFVDHVLRDSLLPYIQRKFPDGHRFQMDNDPKHTSKVSREFMEEKDIKWWSDWPSESPDLNPIESVWGQLKKNLAKQTLTTKQQLVDAIYRFWAVTMTPRQCQVHIDHVYKVIPVCVFLEGKATAKVPDHLFPRSDRSFGKDIGYYTTLLNSPEYEAKRRQYACLK